MIFIKISNNF